jgi:hypothetical protein
MAGMSQDRPRVSSGTQPTADALAVVYDGVGFLPPGGERPGPVEPD